MPHPRLLLLGDDSPEIGSLGVYLRDAGYAVRVWRSPELLLHEVRRNSADLLVLDIDAVGAGCPAFCTSFLATSRAPILVLSSATNRRCAVECVETHAEAYLDKKSPPEIVAANVRSLLRRLAPAGGAGVTPFQAMFNDGHLAIDHSQRRVYVAGKPVYLTRTEYKLLVCFAGAPGQLLPYSRLLEVVWEDNRDAQVNHMHTYVARLKRKITPPHKEHHYFENERGEGYRFRPAV